MDKLAYILAKLLMVQPSAAPSTYLTNDSFDDHQPMTKKQKAALRFMDQQAKNLAIIEAKRGYCSKCHTLLTLKGDCPMAGMLHA